MKMINDNHFYQILKIMFTVIRIVDIVIGSAIIILVSFLVLIVGSDQGGDDLWLWYMNMVTTVPFIALILNGTLNKWERPPGKTISIILFIVFLIATACAVFYLCGMLIEQEPVAAVIFFGALVLLFLINAGLTLRGVFRKKSRELKE